MLLSKYQTMFIALTDDQFFKTVLIEACLDAVNFIEPKDND